MSTPPTALLLFTLGPVQGFIAAGRRTADLWAGSALLSRLADAAVGAITRKAGEEEFDVDVLFPDLSTGSDDATGLPNRFLARVPVNRAEALAQVAEAAVREEMRAASTFALERVGLDSVDLGSAERFIETTWVAVPDAEADALARRLYSDADEEQAHARRYRLIEGLSGARKALRPFKGGTESGYRCSLIPTLPALVPPGDPDPRDVGKFWGALARDSGGRIRKGERLSLVALAKRYYPEHAADRERDREAFPSTSTFAAADFIRAVLQISTQNAELAEAARRFDHAVGDLSGSSRFTEALLPALDGVANDAVGQFAHRSGRLLLSDLTVRAFKNDLPDVDQSTLEPQIEAISTARTALLRAAEVAGVPKPSRYYALLVLDGDRMGQWLSGNRRFGDNRDALSGPERHRAISQALRRFAGEHVPKIVEHDHLGRLVYGGGDDVLAFLSFETALDAARSLYEAFRVQSCMGSNATASAGLVFAHHLTPLQLVLDAAREAEHQAKTLGRDRLTLTALKRSGEPAVVTVPWSGVSALRAYVDLVARRATDASVATSYVHDLARLARRTVPEKDERPTLRSAAYTAEARRLFGRRVNVADGAQDGTAAAAFERSVGETLGLLGPRGTVAALQVAQFVGLGGDR